MTKLLLLWCWLLAHAVNQSRGNLWALKERPSHWIQSGDVVFTVNDSIPVSSSLASQLEFGQKACNLYFNVRYATDGETKPFLLIQVISGPRSLSWSSDTNQLSEWLRATGDAPTVLFSNGTHQDSGRVEWYQHSSGVRGWNVTSSQPGFMENSASAITALMKSTTNGQILGCQIAASQHAVHPWISRIKDGSVTASSHPAGTPSSPNNLTSTASKCWPDRQAIYDPKTGHDLFLVLNGPNNAGFWISTTALCGSTCTILQVDWIHHYLIVLTTQELVLFPVIPNAGLPRTAIPLPADITPSTGLPPKLVVQESCANITHVSVIHLIGSTAGSHHPRLDRIYQLSIPALFSAKSTVDWTLLLGPNTIDSRIGADHSVLSLYWSDALGVSIIMTGVSTNGHFVNNSVVYRLSAPESLEAVFKFPPEEFLGSFYVHPGGNGIFVCGENVYQSVHGFQYKRIGKLANGETCANMIASQWNSRFFIQTTARRLWVGRIDSNLLVPVPGSLPSRYFYGMEQLDGHLYLSTLPSSDAQASLILSDYTYWIPVNSLIEEQDLSEHQDGSILVPVFSGGNRVRLYSFAPSFQTQPTFNQLTERNLGLVVKVSTGSKSGSLRINSADQQGRWVEGSVQETIPTAVIPTEISGYNFCISDINQNHLHEFIPMMAYFGDCAAQTSVNIPTNLIGQSITVHDDYKFVFGSFLIQSIVNGRELQLLAVEDVGSSRWQNASITPDSWTLYDFKDWNLVLPKCETAWDKHDLYRQSTQYMLENTTAIVNEAVLFLDNDQNGLYQPVIHAVSSRPSVIQEVSYSSSFTPLTGLYELTLLYQQSQENFTLSSTTIQLTNSDTSPLCTQSPPEYEFRTLCPSYVSYGEELSVDLTVALSNPNSYTIEGGLSMFELLPINYRPPSKYGYQIAVTPNVYNSDPTQALPRTDFAISANTEQFLRCNATACSCTTEQRVSSDPMDTDCMQYIPHAFFDAPYIPKIAQYRRGIKYETVETKLKIREINGRTDWCLTSMYQCGNALVPLENAIWDPLSNDTITWMGHELFHFELSDTRNVQCPIRAYVKVYVILPPTHYVTNLLIMTWTATGFCLILTIAYIMDKKIHYRSATR